MRKTYHSPCCIIESMMSESMLAISLQKSEEGGEEQLTRRHTWKSNDEDF